MSKIVTVCNDPDDIPNLMNAFAKTTLASWRKCNTNDIKAVSQCLAEVFFQFTDIHPFDNANGRTATCLVNVFLKSIGLPSILMRNPGDRDDSSSSYTLAINAINQTREPFANHIYQRILAAQSQPFADEKLAETIVLRWEVAHQLQLLQKKHPQIDINDSQQVIVNISYLSKVQALTDTNEKSILAMNLFLAYLAQEGEDLDQSLSKGMPKITSSTSTTTSTSTQSGQLTGGGFYFG